MSVRALSPTSNLPSPPRSDQVNGVDINQLENVNKRMNDKARQSSLYFIGKLAQTILLYPFTTTATLICRSFKLLVWDCAKAGLYKVSGYHTEAADFLELQYLKTVKALRDILAIPTLVKRVYNDIVAEPEQFVDDIKSMKVEDYLKVYYTRGFQLYSSYLHGCKTFEVIKPEGITEFPARSDAALNTVMASHFLKPGMMAINFGTPNVSTFITKEEEDGSVQTVQVDAKSLKRADMSYHVTNGKIQSGVFFVPTNLPQEALERFNRAAETMQGRRDITCVNTNCRVLEEAGFSIEAVNMQEIVFPNTLVEHLLFRNVFYTDLEGNKHKVHFDIIQTTPHSLEEYFEKVDTAVVGTRFRHSRRNADTEEQKEARGEAARALIAAEKTRLSAKQPSESVNDEDLGKRKITVSVPSFLGDAVARIWGRHTMYEVDLSDKREEILAAFQSRNQEQNGPLKLRPFSQTNPSFATKLKRDIFFSKPMIRFLRRHMMGQADSIHIKTQDLFNFLKSTKDERLNYVLLENKVVLAKTQANANRDEAHRKVADWALSKHALLANREEAYCSGEIWYDGEQDCFMLNNDSGTYEPAPERVAIVANLANTIFDTQRFGNVFKVAAVA